MKSLFEKKGFTLIELFLYMSLALIMIAAISGMGVQVLEGRTKAKAQEEVQYAGQFVVESITATLAEAERIVEPVPMGRSTQLVLEMEDDTLNPTIISLQDQSVQIQQGDKEPVWLIGNGVSVPSLDFYRAGEKGVRLILEVASFNPEQRGVFAASTTIYTTIDLRP